jgi:outer membrane protein assembly factor BamB
MKPLVSLMLCVFLVAVAAGCGSGNRSGVLQPAGNHAEANGKPDVEASLAQIKAAPVPEGIDPVLFKRLTSELSRVILKNPSVQVAQHPPVGTANRISGIRFAQDTPGSWKIRWDYLNRGDYDQNGFVGISDLTPLGIHFGKSGPFDRGSIESLVDGDGNGEINLSDITPIGVNYQAFTSAYNVYSSDNPRDCPTAWDGPNGPDAQLLGRLETADVLEVAVGRAVFSLAVDQPVAGRCYWIRPTDGISEGSASLNGGLNSWSQFGHDAQNTRCSPYVASQTGTLKWTWQSTGPTDYYSDPAIGKDGSIYFGSRTGLQALNPDGSVRWRAGPSELVFDTAVAPDGTIYASTYVKGLYAYKPDGTLKWQHAEANGWNTTAPAFAPDSTAYLGTTTNSVTAFTTLGQVQWVFETGGAVDASPVVAADGTILAVCADNNLYAINPDGTERWTYQMEGKGNYSALAAGADRVYAVCTNKLYALSLSGAELWTYEFPADVASAATEGVDGTVYVSVEDQSLVAVNPDGTYQWSCPFADQPRKDAAVSQDGTIFVCSLYRLYAVNADGTHKWAFKPDHLFNGAPVLGLDGSICTGGSDDLFYALNADGSLKWTYGPGAGISSPVIGADGTLFTRTDRRLHALNPDGRLKWFHDGHYYLSSSPVISPHGPVYMSDHMGFLYSLNADGSMNWETDWYVEYGAHLLQADDGTLYADNWYGLLAVIDPDGTIVKDVNTLQGYDGAMALSPDGTLYVCREWPNDVVALDSNCEQIWTYDCFADFVAVGPSGTVYTEDSSVLVALDPNGTFKWSLFAGQETGGLAIAPDETLYVATYENRIVAVNPDGTEKWRFQAKLPDEEGVTACCTFPAVGADGLVYFGSEEVLYCLGPEINEVWTHTLPGRVASPTIGADGTVYVGCSDGKLYAFGD